MSTRSVHFTSRNSLEETIARPLVTLVKRKDLHRAKLQSAHSVQLNKAADDHAAYRIHRAKMKKVAAYFAKVRAYRHRVKMYRQRLKMAKMEVQEVPADVQPPDAQP